MISEWLAVVKLEKKGLGEEKGEITRVDFL